MRVEPVVFESGGNRLVGLIHVPSTPAKKAVIILVGGPQYRVGAHRQYVHLARHLAENGVVAMRFDWTGIGDSEGDYPGFTDLSEDCTAALDCLTARLPELREISLWGLCEGASSILIDGVRDPRITGAILVNPWVRTESGEAKAFVKHYYAGRVFSRQFWRRVFKGEVAIGKSMADFMRKTRLSLQGADDDAGSYQSRMLRGLKGFSGQVLLIQSGHDLVAREFDDFTTSDSEWRTVLQQAALTRRDLTDSDHTFSREVWRQQVARWTADWVRGEAG